jgi:hypothetical protein
MSEDTPSTTVTPPVPTDPTPVQQPGPNPAPPEPVPPVVTAETPERVKEATDYVMSKGYSLAAATKIIAEYGVDHILSDKGKDPEEDAPAEQVGKAVFSGDLVPGRTSVRVFNVDGRKPLKIEEMRDAGTEIDIYVRL